MYKVKIGLKSSNISGINHNIIKEKEQMIFVNDYCYRLLNKYYNNIYVYLYIYIY